MNRTIAVAVIMSVLAGTVGACANSRTAIAPAAVRATPATFVLAGNVGLKAGDYEGRTPCAGAGGYRNIQAGAKVVIVSASGTVLATGQLSAGAVDAASGDCCLPLAVPGVPVGYAFYGLVVAGYGPHTIPAAQAEAGGIVVNLR